MRLNLYFFFFLFSKYCLFGQIFSYEDSLRGFLNEDRKWFDVKYYNLSLDVNFNDRSISGYNDIFFNVIDSKCVMQLDLDKKLKIDSVVFNNNKLEFRREFNSFFLTFTKKLEENKNYKLRIYYSGSPKEAINPPWDGGFVWLKDYNNFNWLGVACQDEGASIWWPCKDHLSDKPDSMRVSCKIPKKLKFICNGNIESDSLINDKKRQTTWKISYPINIYNVSLNIGNYVNINDMYFSDNDSLVIDYYVIEGNENKAFNHFKQVKPMLKVYEELFDKYPFWDDGYALIESSYLGMEHQSGIAYGNDFKNGYLGKYPKNIDFDFIIIHESAHEYWGNSVSVDDMSELWIHESFATYTEALFVEKKYGFESMLDYLRYQKQLIKNDKPIIGVHGVNSSGSKIDMYYKGSWMLHSIRNTVLNDTLWFKTIKDFYNIYKFKIISTIDVVNFFSKKLKYNLEPIFSKFLQSKNLPVLEYFFENNNNNFDLNYKWDIESKNFNMPISISIDSQRILLFPGSEFKKISLNIKAESQCIFENNYELYEKLKYKKH